MTICVFDTETASLECGVVQLASVTISPEGESEYCELMNPGMPIDPGASAIHGIFDHHVTNYIPAEAAVKAWWEGILATHERTLQKYNVPLVLIGHNTAFDRRMLAPYVDISLSRAVCTLYWSRKLYPGAANHKLTTMYSHLGFTAEQKAHDALGDVRMTMDILSRICEHAGMSAYALSSHAMEVLMPFGKHKGLPIKDLPKDYLIWLSGLDNLSPELRVEVAKYA